MSAQLKEIPEIRRMLVTDLDKVISIEQEVFLFPWTRGNFRDSINSGYHCYVFELEGSIFGYGVMTICVDEAHILTLSIAAGFQGEGWGEKLLQYFIGLARANHSLSVFLEVRESNFGAARLYQRIGFKPIATRIGYYPAMGGREDAIVMELKL